MTSKAHRTGVFVRVMTTPRLRPILTAMAAIVLLTGATLPGAVLAAPSVVTPVAVVAAAPAGSPSPAVIVERAPSDQARLTPAPAVPGVDRPAAPSPIETTPTIAVKTALKPAAAPVPVAVAKPIVRVATPKIVSLPAEPVVYSGADHVWIPALGVDRSVYGFACTRAKAPDNLTYRWGCAGSNNVYLMGHAFGVFKPLHDAYYNGKLKKGLQVMYADSSGTVHTYAVTWWKVVKPTTDAAWAWAPLASPGMTLQTCLGATSAYRLMVRLDQVG